MCCMLQVLLSSVFQSTLKSISCRTAWFSSLFYLFRVLILKMIIFIISSTADVILPCFASAVSSLLLTASPVFSSFQIVERIQLVSVFKCLTSSLMQCHVLPVKHINDFTYTVHTFVFGCVYHICKHVSKFGHGYAHLIHYLTENVLLTICISV